MSSAIRSLLSWIYVVFLVAVTVNALYALIRMVVQAFLG